MLDPWPDEPDEYSPETRWGNPERDLPRIPEVSTDEQDVDPHTFKTFWVSVVFANAALFGASLGLMLWYFRGQALLGGSLVVVGLLAGARTYVAYRTFKTEQRGDGEQRKDGQQSESGGDDVDEMDGVDDGGSGRIPDAEDGDTGRETDGDSDASERNG